MAQPDYVPSDAENIEDHGAVEGTDTISAAESNVTAINDAGAASAGNNVYIPAGTYYIGDEFAGDFLSFGRSAVDRGVAGTSIYGNDPTTSFLVVASGAPSDVGLQIEYHSDSSHGSVTWRGLTYDGNYEAINVDVDNGNQRAFVLTGGGDFTWQNCRIRNFYGGGIRIADLSNHSFEMDRCTVRDIAIERLNKTASQGSPSTEHVWQGGWIDSTLTITNSEFELVAGTIIDFDGTGSTATVTNNWVSGVGTAFTKVNETDSADISQLYYQGQSQALVDALNSAAINDDFDGRQFLYRLDGDPTVTPTFTLNDIQIEDLPREIFWIRERVSDDSALDVDVTGGDAGPVQAINVSSDSVRPAAIRDRISTLTFNNFGELGVHTVDGTVFDMDNGAGSISDLHYNGTDGLGTTGGVTVSTANQGGAQFSPTVPSQGDVGINTGAEEQFSTDFSEYVGSLFSGWTAEWSATTSDFAAVSDTTAIYGDALLELDASDSERMAVSWDQTGTPGDTDIAALVELPAFDPNLEDYCRVYARGAGGAGSEEAYFLTIRSDGFYVRKYTGGGAATTITSFGSPSADQRYWFRFRVTGTGTVGENQLRARVWLEGNSEPSAWDVDTIDSNSGTPEQGWPGFGGFSSVLQQCDYFAVGTNGATAPLPSGVDVSAAPDGPVEVGAETPDVSASTTSPFVAADGPVEVGTSVPDAGATVANVSAAPSGPVEVGAETPDVGLFLATDSEPLYGSARFGDTVLGGVSDSVSAAPSGPVEVDAETPDAGGNVYIEFTTALPDVTGLSIDDTVEDELTPSWTDTINNGSFRIQHKISDTAAWIDDGTVDQTTTSFTIAPLVDGEEYDVRVRSETEHVEGAWVEGTATTPLPAPTNLATANADPTQWDITWTDTADNEDDYLVERRRQYDDGFGPWTTVATLAANTTSYTDDGVIPETTYEYRITARTEHVTSATTVQATTPALDATYDSATVSSTGWTVEVDRSDTGATRRPAIVGEPRYDPSLNSLPEVRLPVAQDDAWSQSQWEDAPIRVWRDGVRLPIEQVSAVEQQPGQTVITALGGTELLEPQTHEFDDSDAHAAANAVIDNTSYAKVVDDPSADQSQLADPDTDAELREYFEDPADASDPVIVDNGQRMAQTTFWVEGEDEVASGSVIDNVDHPNGDPVWSGAEAADVDNAGGVALTITTEHVIPAADFGIAVRYNNDNLDADWAVYVDGTEISRLSWGGSTTSDTAALFDLSSGTATWLQSDLQPGDHTIEFRIENRVSGTTYLDAMAIYDGGEHDPNNWSFTSWDTDVYFNDPPLYPTGGTDAVLLHEGFQSATGATFDGTFDDLSGAQGIALSNDGGSNYTTAANTDTLDVDFSSPGPDIQLRVTYDAYGSRAIGTPLQNFKTQTLTDYTIDIDTRNSPPLQDDVFRSEGRQILTRLAERGIGLWAVTWDDTNGLTVEFTNAGQRTSTETLDLVDYAWSKETLGRQIEWAVVRGAAQPVQGEEFTADAGGDALDQNNLVPGRERVYDTSKVYTRGTDYTINYEVGEISRETGGDLTSGDTYQVDYEWKPEGEYARGATDPKKKLEETFVGATTDTLCRSIAYYLTDPEQLGAPVRSGEAVISDLPPGVSVLDALALDPVPETDTYHVEGIERRPGEVRLQLASRESISDVVGDVRSRLEDASERV